MTKRILLSLAALLFCASQAFAQAPTVEVGKAYKVIFDSTGGPLVSGFRVYICAGTVADCPTKVGADIPSSALVAGTVTVDVTAVVSRGNYTVQASVFNADKESKSPPLAYQAVLATPPAPSVPRIAIIATPDANGHIVWDWRFIDEPTAEQILASR